MANLQCILLRFAEPFMDANYSKVRICCYLYYRLLSGLWNRLSSSDGSYRSVLLCSFVANWFERRNENQSYERGGHSMGRGESGTWRYASSACFNSLSPVWPFCPSLFHITAPPPNFISDIFYLTIAMSHYGYLRTIQTYHDFEKHIEDIQQHLDRLNGDGSWMGVSDFLSDSLKCRLLTKTQTPLQARTEAAIQQMKVSHLRGSIILFPGIWGNQRDLLVLPERER